MVDAFATADADVALDGTVLGLLLDLVPREACPFSPVPGRHEVTLPDAQLGRGRLPFVLDVVGRVVAVGHRPPRGDHPGVQVLVTRVADGHDSVVTIKVPRVAAHGTAADPVGQSEGCLLAAAGLLACHRAELAALWSIYAVKAYAGAVDVEGIPIDDRGTASDCLALIRRHLLGDVGEAAERVRRKLEDEVAGHGPENQPQQEQPR